MTNAPELGSEKFTRWAHAIWPYTVGIFGMTLIIIDAVIVPPPGQTSLMGLGLVTGQGVIGLKMFKGGGGND